jgi:hypothetical protein
MSDTRTATQGYNLAEECRKRGWPTSITNPYDLEPAGWAKASEKSGAVKVDFSTVTCEPRMGPTK